MTDSQGIIRYLRRVRHIDKEIDATQQAADAIYHKLTSIKTSTIKDINVQESNRTTTEDRIVQYVDMQEKIDKMVDELVNLKDKIMTEINQMDDTVHKSILIRRYILSESWSEVSDAINYSPRRTTTLHGTALIEFYNTNQKEVDDYIKRCAKNRL